MKKKLSVMVLLILITMATSSFSTTFTFKSKDFPNLKNTNKETKLWVKVSKDSKYGIINQYNEIIIPIEYDWVRMISEGLITVQKNDKWGYINKNNEIVIPFEYDWAYKPGNGLLAVRKNGKWGYIDANNEVMIPFIYDQTYGFSDGVAKVKINGKWKKINTNNEFIKEPNIPSKSISKNGKWGYIDKEKNINIPFEYDLSFYFRNGLAKVFKNGKSGFINEKGEIIIPIEYDFCHIFKDGLVQVTKNNKTGFININNEIVIPLEYRNTKRYFVEGLLGVSKEFDKWGYINKKNELVIPYKERSVHDFSNGLARVSIPKPYELGMLDGFINKKGELVIPFEYSSNSNFVEVKDSSIYEYESHINLIDNYISENLSDEEITNKVEEMLTITLDYTINSNEKLNINEIISKKLKTNIEEYDLLKEELNRKLNEEGIKLNRNLSIILNINILSNNSDDFTLIYSLLKNNDIINEINVNYLNDIIFKLNRNQLNKIFEKKNSLKINYSYKDNSISFDRVFSGNIGIILPVDSKNKVVYLNDANIGGSYQEELNGILFYVKEDTKISIKDTIRPNFKDTNNISNEMKNSINFLYTKGIISGKNDNIFDPNGYLTRAEFSKMIVKILYELEKNLEEDFIDVNKNDWFNDYVASARKSKLIKGYSDKTFRPSQKLSKEQTLVIISRALVNNFDYTNIENLQYLSKENYIISSWAEKEIELVFQESIINSNEFIELQSPITRGEVCIFLKRLYDKIY